MSQANYSVVTKYGREWNALAAAGETVSPIVEMVFGDGERLPTGGETDLLNVVHRKVINAQGTYEDQSAAWFDAYLEAEVGGFVIREHGLVTADGNLVAIGVRNPGIPKADPTTGAADDFTYRIDLFFDELDALVVQLEPIHGLTGERRVFAGDGLKVTHGGRLGSDPTYSLDRATLLSPPVQKFVLTSDWQKDMTDDNAAAQAVLEQRIFDSIKENHSDAAGMLFLGDLWSRGVPSSAEVAANSNATIVVEDRRVQVSDLKGLFSLFFMEPGNHEFNFENVFVDPEEGESLTEYLRYFPAARYHIEMGNLVFIFMGDEKAGKTGFISDETVEWWDEIHLAKQEHSLVITATHQSPPGTINPEPFDATRHIADFERFNECMTRAKRPVKSPLWLCGHSGKFPLENTDHRTALLNGSTRVIQVGAHVPGIAGSEHPPTYWTMNLTAGSKDVEIKHWNVETGAYVDANEITVQSPVPLRLQSMPEFDGRSQKHQRFDPDAQLALAHAASTAWRVAKQELQIRALMGAPTANMETAL